MDLEQHFSGECTCRTTNSDMTAASLLSVAFTDLRTSANRNPTPEFNASSLVACNVEIESNICYQSVCLEQRSDCRGPNLKNCRHERARGCGAPVTCAVRG